MPGKSYIAETRELAFRTWRAQGENVEQTVKTLKKEHGVGVTKPTIYGWMEKFNWKERATRADAEAQKTRDVIVSDEERILADLEKQRKKYEQYFETLGVAAIDPQATYAYNSLAKTITDIKCKMRLAGVKAQAKKTADDVAQTLKNGGMSEDTAKEIRRKILGIL